MLIVLALIGTVAISSLVVGLLNVHAVTNHFPIH
jgi:F0F1-type ATP synthase membrane subunit c/vacuolar-type H+-ATPase subunit K